MRSVRILVLALAFALMALVAPGSASAKTAPEATPAPTTTSNAGTAARVTKLSFKIVKRDGKLFGVGYAKPRPKKVIIQKATSCNKANQTCNFKWYKTIKPKANGYYRVRVTAPRRGSFAWRSRVGTKASAIWYTCVIRAGSGGGCPVP